MQLRERLRNFSGDPGLHPYGAGGSFRGSSEQFCFILLQAARADRQTAQSAMLLHAVPVSGPSISLPP